MDKEQKIISGNYVKVALIITIFLLVIGGLIGFLFKYYELYSQISSNVNKNPMQQEAVDLAKLSAEYYSRSQEIISNYLSNSAKFLAQGNLSEETEKTRNDLLALKVPAEAKAKHLSMVLMLEEINRLARNNDSEKISQKLEEFKTLVKSESKEIEIK